MRYPPKLAVSIHPEPDMFAQYMRDYNNFDVPVTNLIIHVLSEIEGKVTFLDIGSFVGYYSALASFCGVHKVISMDAFPQHNQKTCETLQLNSFHNVGVYNFLLGNRRRYQQWCAPLDNLAFSISEGCPSAGDEFFNNYITNSVLMVHALDWMEQNMNSTLNNYSGDEELVIRIHVSEGFEEQLVKMEELLHLEFVPFLSLMD